jgi:hypothetical protein
MMEVLKKMIYFRRNGPSLIYRQLDFVVVVVHSTVARLTELLVW